MSKYFSVDTPGANYISTVKHGDVPKVKEGYLLIKNHAIALNPVDWKVYVNGYFIKSWPATVGVDIAGIVEEVGPNVHGFKKGDRVFGFTNVLLSQNPEHGGFREHTVLPEKGAFKIPPNISFEQAATIPTGVLTATDGLYYHLKLPHPEITAKTTTNAKENLLVLGGSSSVGSFVVQFASKSYRTLATASPHNHALVASLGAAKLFNQQEHDLAQKIIAEGHVKIVFDCVSNVETLKLGVEVLVASGGGTLIAVLATPEEIKNLVVGKNIQIVNVFAGNIYLPEGEKYAQWLSSGYLSGVFESGSIVPNIPEVIGNSLESIHPGLKRLEEGKVSGKKLVVKLI